jgi:hypothetical protein
VNKYFVTIYQDNPAIGDRIWDRLEFNTISGALKCAKSFLILEGCEVRMFKSRIPKPRRKK